MVDGQRGTVVRNMNRLFEVGSAASATEGQLLERFVNRGDEAAFEALVARHGPMVLGVCRRMLRQPGDVEDAFQATFLILVRRAGSIRNRELLGNWLYGVAHRVSLRARGKRTAVILDRELDHLERDDADPGDTDAFELRAVLDEELSRLPEKYRRPIVLCYLEGHTHEEAATRLKWPVGTVRGRMARGRELLRGRLARRGFAPASALLTAALTEDARAAVPELLVMRTVRSAILSLTGQGAAAGAVSAAAVALANRVLRSFAMTKLTWVGAGVFATGLLAASHFATAWQNPAPVSAPEPARLRSNAQVPPPPAGSNVGQTEVKDATPLDPSKVPREALSLPEKTATTAPPGVGPLELPAPPNSPSEPPTGMLPDLQEAPIPPSALTPSDPVEPVVEVDQFLAQTRANVDRTVTQLDAEVKTLTTRIAKAKTDLVRLRALQAALNAPNAGTDLAFPVSPFEVPREKAHDPDPDMATLPPPVPTDSLSPGAPRSATPDAAPAPTPPAAGTPTPAHESPKKDTATAPSEAEASTRAREPKGAVPGPGEADTLPGLRRTSADVTPTGSVRKSSAEGTNPSDTSSTSPPRTPGRIAVGDIIHIDVLEALPGRPLSGSRPVRSDGTISLDYYGDLPVAGLTREEAKVHLVKKLQKYLTDEALGLVAVNAETDEPIAIEPAETDRVFVDETPREDKDIKSRLKDLEHAVQEQKRVEAQILKLLEELKNPPKHNPEA